MQRKNRKFTKILALFLCLTFLAGCGKQTDDGNVSSTESDVASSSDQSVDMEELFTANGNEESIPDWAGTQYYRGEAISIWRKRNGSEDLQKAQDIYMYDEHGNAKRVVAGTSGDYTGTWFLTQEGYCLTILDNKLVRVETDGKETFNVNVAGGILDICQLNDGRIMMIIEEGTGSHKIAELNPENGEYTKLETLDFGRDKRVYISAGENGLILLKSDGFWDVNTETEELTSVMPMSEYDYKLAYTIKDFRLLPGGSAEFLLKESTEVILPKDIEKYREVVIVQTRFGNGWLQALLDDFNESNYEYYAVMEEHDSSSMSLADFKNGLEKQFAAGGGPDLIDIDCMDSTYVEKGYLEDLTPYMEKTGVDPLDYFPITFEYQKVGDSIYVANLQIQMSGLRIKEEVLGSREVPDVETLMDALLGYPEAAVLNKGWSSQTVLHYFLAGSEDLWGIIDWENGTCDFQSDFFAKALETSLLFGDDGNDLPAVAELYNTGLLYNYINEEQLKLAKEVYIGFLFDSGSHPWMLTGQTMSINSNSTCKDGAWAVIQYILSEEAQTQKALTLEDGRRFADRFCPVNVYAYEAMVLLEQEETSIYEYELNGDKVTVYKAGQEALREMNWDKDAYRALYDLKEMDTDEIRDMLYEVSYMPGKPSEILDIVYEEAASYFTGTRSLGDTCDAIQERAQAYLDEFEE